MRMSLNDSALSEKLNNFREKFLAIYDTNIKSNSYDKRDLDRLNINNIWLHAFYMHVRGKHDIIPDLIHDVLTWRKEFGANDLIKDGQLPFPEELIKKGGLYFKNSDKNGTPLLHFATKTHKKDAFPHDQVCRFIAYHLEKSYKFSWSNQIVLLFDMVDAGLGNLDMEMIKFVITCLKVNYPGLIDYMLIFQMPFLFNAAWKIIKNWLPPEALQIIKFVDKKSIREYVNENQLFLHMGGSDTYTFKYEPQATPSEIKKRVSFASIDALPDMPRPESASNIGATIDQSKSSNNTYLTINPGDEILFILNDNKTDLIQYLNLTNTSGFSLAYKIKITSPDKFRVKPGCGIIEPWQSLQVLINFLKEFHYSSSQHRDKFLVLWTKIDENSKQIDINEFWKQAHANKAQIYEHKLKCVVSRSEKEAQKALTENQIHRVSSLNKQNSISDTFYSLPNNTTTTTSIKNTSAIDSTLSKNNNGDLREIKTRIDNLTQQQTRLNQKFTLLIYLLYILIFINLMQIFFESTFYDSIVQPFIEDKFQFLNNNN